MTDVFDIYGFLERDIDVEMRVLSDALEVSFVPHESTFLGDYYLARSDDWKEQLRLKENYNQIENDWSRPEFQKYPLLLEVSVTSLARAQELERRILSAGGQGASLLRRKEYPSE